MEQAELPLFNEPDPREALRTSGGRDELNLAEFPITLLADRVPNGCKTLVFEDTIFDQQANSMVTRRLTITGSDKYGLPTGVDDEILVALIQLTKLGNNFTEKRQSFSRYELLKLLDWGDRGENYDRIEESLNRWMGVTLYYDKAWWDKDSKSWIDAKFHILESVFLVDQDARRKRKLKGDHERLLSWFSWNEVVFRSFQAENLKRLDVDTYFSLKSSTSKRIYRFLDKRFYHKREWKFDLKDFAYEHVGMSRNYTPPKIKEKLQPAIEELTSIGFLEPLSREERYAKAGHGIWKIILIQKCQVSSEKPRKSEISELERELVSRGVSPLKASELVASHDVERIRVKIEIFDWMISTKDKRATKSPVGYLVKSIEDDYSAPKGFETNAERAAREARDEAKRKDEKIELEAKRQARIEQAREKAVHQKVLSYWNGLSLTEQHQLDEDAKAKSEPTLLEAFNAISEKKNPMADAYFKSGIRWPYIRELIEADKPH